MNPILDTNIIIDYLKGVSEAKEELGYYKKPAISIITWMEVLVGTQDDAEITTLRRFLARFQIIQLDESVAKIAIDLRKAHRMRLPDAIIWASAQSIDRVLVTRNTRDFPETHPSIRVPYAL